MLPRADRVRYEEAAEDLRTHYRTTGIRDLAEAGARFKHLDLFFRGRRLADISGATATQYVARRQAEGAANGTINREVGVLLKLMHLAHEHNKLHRVPKIRTLKEAAPRQGFFETDQFLAVRARLPEDLQVAVSLAFELGWRIPSEVLTLERRQLDVMAGAIRLEPGSTKNDDGRMVYVTPGLRTLLAGQVARVEVLQRRLDRIVPYLFPHLRKGMLAGKRRRNFTKAWQRACREAGVPGMLRHDFRRTAVRNMVNADVPERVAMKVTGHKTRSVFDRYHIVSPGAAGRSLTADGYNSGHTGAGREGTWRATSQHY
jgi:integrase